MKALNYYLAVLLCFCVIFTGCTKTDDLLSENPESHAKNSYLDKIISVPFNLSFTGSYTSIYTDGKLIKGVPLQYVVIDGTGLGSPVGISKIHLEFCCRAKCINCESTAYPVSVDGDTVVVCHDIVKPVKLSDHSLDGNYETFCAYIVGKNIEDTLFIQLEGTVKSGRLKDHLPCVTSYWRDPFIISGGTGRYEEAIGWGTTDDYNSREDAFSHHNWNGTIILKDSNNNNKNQKNFSEPRKVF